MAAGQSSQQGLSGISDADLKKELNEAKAAASIQKVLQKEIKARRTAGKKTKRAVTPATPKRKER